MIETILTSLSPYRYGLPIQSMTGEEIVHEVAEKFYKGNTISAADKLLGDFRRGFLGSSSLEAPVDSELWTKPSEREREENEKEAAEREKNERKAAAAASAEERRKKEVTAAVPVQQQQEEDNVDKGMSFGKNLDIGKGNYDGW
jgi:hypothetical protein